MTDNGVGTATVEALTILRFVGGDNVKGGGVDTAVVATEASSVTTTNVGAGVVAVAIFVEVIMFAILTYAKKKVI